jgi:hypothetical protein
MPRTRTSGLSLRAALLGTATALLAAAGVGAATASAPAEPAPPVSVAMTGDFTFHACPAGTPAADACLTDHVSGSLPGSGPVAGVFEVHIAFSQAAADHCQPIDKHGSFTVGSAGSVQLAASGMYCADESIASYNYRVVRGSGSLAHAYGRGQWLVPAPAAYASGAGSGTEYFFGTLHS